MSKFKYEFFLKDGGSFILDEITSLSVTTSDDRNIEKLSIKGSDIKDKLVYINIKNISCIIKREPSKRRFFSWKK